MEKGILIFGFILGVALGSFFDFGESFYFLLAFISFLLLITEYFYKRFLGKEVFLRKISFLFFFIFLGAVWYGFRGNISPDIFLTEGKNSFDAIVVEEPEQKDKSQEIVVVPKEETGGQRILIRTGIYPKYNYGDLVSVDGEIEKPANFDTFDYVSYLANKDISYTMYNPKMTLVSQGNGNRLALALIELKNYFVSGISSAFPEPQASFLSGILIGAKESLGKDLSDEFRVAGLSHVVVLSGYNLTIVADSMMIVLGKIFSRGLTISFGSTAIILFVIMTGGGASSVRAMAMALIVMLAKATGRMYDASYALLAAGVLMVVWDPKILVFDLSFQLSFLATLGLIYVSPVLEKKLSFVPEKFKLREMVATTLGAQTLTTPLILFKIGTFSTYALVSNLLVIALIPATMFFGFFATVLNFVSYYIALPFVAVAWALLSYELFIVHFISSLPYASVSMPIFSKGAILIFVFAILFKIIKIYSRNKNKEVTLKVMKENIRGEKWEIEEISL